MIRVGIALFPPLVMKKDDRYVGFEIELWEKLASDLNLEYEYTEYAFHDLLDALQAKKIDVALAGVTETEERENVVDFSHRTFDSGLRILVPASSRTNIFSFVLNRDVWSVLQILAGFVLIASHLIWFVERGSPSIAAAYIPGIFDALWWSLVTVSTVGYGDIVPTSTLGRLVSMFVILSGLAIFGLYIGKVSSALTLRKIKTNIRTLADLERKRVATVKGSTSVAVLQNYDTRTTTVSHIEEAYPLLERGAVDAVVFDAPTLLHYTHTTGGNKAYLTDRLLEPQSYAVALQQGSALREDLNKAILKARESGFYKTLYTKWFG